MKWWFSEQCRWWDYIKNNVLLSCSPFLSSSCSHFPPTSSHYLLLHTFECLSSVHFIVFPCHSLFQSHDSRNCVSRLWKFLLGIIILLIETISYYDILRRCINLWGCVRSLWLSHDLFEYTVSVRRKERRERTRIIQRKVRDE